MTAQELAPVPPTVEQQQTGGGVSASPPVENSVLRGPADADHYRVKVGRFGTRWYIDPLPGCEIADASDWQGPSISTTKPPFANKYVPMKTIAEIANTEWARLAGVDAAQRYEAIKSHEAAAGQVNMKRGSLIHERAEDLLYGRTAPILPLTYHEKVVAEADKYQAALESFFDTYQPELVAAEVVCLNRTLNGVGYGGTADAFVRIDGAIWLVDWKSRSSDHGAYLEEAAQGAGYGRAEYMVVRGLDAQPMRVHIPEVAGVLIVSIKTDGFKAYPIDLAPAVKVFDGMHRWWVDQQEFTTSKAIGRPWAPKAAPAPTVAAPADPTVIDDLRTRIGALIDAGHAESMRLAWPAVPTLASGHQHTADELAQIIVAVERVEADHAMPFIQTVPEADKPNPQVEVEPTPVPDDGGKVPSETMAALRRRMESLPAAQLAQVTEIAGEAHAAGWSISVQQKPCERRYLIALALVCWAEGGGITQDLFAACGLLATDHQIVDLNQTLGALLGQFTIEQATALHQVFDGTTVDNHAATAA